MCVIAIKPKGVDIPSKDLVKDMWDKNPDGAGFMYSLDNRVYIEKGFMKLEDFNRALETRQTKLTEAGLNAKDIPFILHFRITTHGGTSAANTHPFPVSDNDEVLQSLDVSTDVGMAHNGVINSVTVPVASKLSDTMLYIKEFVSTFKALSVDFLKNEKILKILDATIGFSKLAFLEAGGDIVTVGKFEEKDGMLFSNLNHTYKYRPATTTTTTPYHYYGKTSKTVLGKAFLKALPAKWTVEFSLPSGVYHPTHVTKLTSGTYRVAGVAPLGAISTFTYIDKNNKLFSAYEEKSSIHHSTLFQATDVVIKNRRGKIVTYDDIPTTPVKKELTQKTQVATLVNKNVSHVRVTGKTMYGGSTLYKVDYEGDLLTEMVITAEGQLLTPNVGGYGNYLEELTDVMITIDGVAVSVTEFFSRKDIKLDYIYLNSIDTEEDYCYDC